MPAPSLGAAVRYTLPNGQIRAAWICKYEASKVNVQVLLDGTDDRDQLHVNQPQRAAGLAFYKDVPLDDVTKKPGTWHWPPA